MNNLPIYRAKKLDSDKYAIGYYIPNYVMGEYESEDEDERQEWTEHLIIESFSQDLFVDDESYYNHDNSSQIDPTTLAIHFPDMLANDSDKLRPNGEKDLRIFASLSEDGKGGDICYLKDFYHGDLQGVAKYKSHSFYIDRNGKAMGISLKSSDIEVIGIQE